jgi:8-oxo-dGTP pyrophosphatase MutT (NUDIX family)/phosphohistidine phosphatase SixA
MGEPGPIEAAGAVLWRHGRDGAEVLLIHRPKRDDWSLAKGKREPGEHIVLTAVREVTEETGVRPVLGRRLRTVRYEVNGVPKRVHYWAAARPTPGDAFFVPNPEVDRVEWLPLPRARERLSYSRDPGVLDDFAEWPRETVPLILLRHASAGNKGDWPGDDLLRPLDEQGQADALTLAALLDCYGPRRVVSSPAKRCVDTVAPYAARIGAPVETDAALGPPGRSPEQSSGRTSSGDPASPIARVAADGVPAVVCTHRENIPGLLAAACQQFGAAPPADPSLAKGSFWVLQIGDGKLVGLERQELSGPSGG